MVSLSEIAHVAPLAGFPSDKTALKRRLAKAGVTPTFGTTRGGKCLLFPFDRLPPQLRSQLAERAPSEASHASQGFDAYLNAPPSLREEAERLQDMCRRVKALLGTGQSPTAAFASIAAEFDVSAPKVRRYWKKVEGLHQADWLPALVKGYRGRQAQEIPGPIWQYFLSIYGRVEAPQLQAAYEWTVKAAQLHGWGEVPSLKTLKRRWDAIPAAERVRMRKGDRAADEMYPHVERDRSGMLPLDSLNMDSRKWDNFVLLRDGRRDRPVVTIAHDERSNLILAYEVTETESSHSYRRVLCSVFENIGIYKVARFDNTFAAANKALTAGARSRFRYKQSPDDIAGLLPRVGCEPRFTLPYNGRSKLCERAFAELKERSEKHPAMAGAYVGRSTSHKPENYGQAAVPIETFKAILHEAIEHYNNRRDRRSKVAFGKSHREVFEEGLASVAVRKLTQAEKRYFFSIGEKRKVSPSGCIALGTRPHVNRYFDKALQDFAGCEVVAWYNPDDLTAPLMVETLDGRMICDEVTLLEQQGFNSKDAAREYQRQKRAERRAQKEAIKARGLMDAAEVAAALSPVSPPEMPTAKVVQPAKGFRKGGKSSPASQGDAEFHELLAKGSRREREERKSGRLAG